jgi:hypothetical protein
MLAFICRGILVTSFELFEYHRSMGPSGRSIRPVLGNALRKSSPDDRVLDSDFLDRHIEMLVQTGLDTLYE